MANEQSQQTQPDPQQSQHQPSGLMSHSLFGGIEGFVDPSTIESGMEGWNAFAQLVVANAHTLQRITDIQSLRLAKQGVVQQVVAQAAPILAQQVTQQVLAALQGSQPPQFGR